MLAEQVLLKVLDAEVIEVADIRAALSSLQMPAPEPEPKAPSQRLDMLEKIAGQVAACLEAHESWARSFDDDSLDMDDLYVAWQASFEKLRPLLDELK